MRPVNYFKNRIEFALKGNGTIKVNQNDLEALNQIIEFYNTNYKNTQLEDSLLLFYILQNWKVENIKNEKIRMSQVSNEQKGIFEISDSIQLLKKIGSMLAPKSHLIQFITIELQCHQRMNNVPKEKLITEEIVRELLDKELQIAKSEFTFIKSLNKEKEVVFIYPEGLSEAQRKMLGLK